MKLGEEEIVLAVQGHRKGLLGDEQPFLHMTLGHRSWDIEFPLHVVKKPFLLPLLMNYGYNNNMTRICPKNTCGFELYQEEEGRNDSPHPPRGEKMPLDRE